MNTSDRDRDGLLMRYFDGTISPQERTALNTLLLEDADARALLREIVEQAVAMGDLARERAHASPRVLSERMRSPVRWRMSLAWAAIAAVVLMAGAAALWFLQGPVSEVVTLEQISGAVTLSTDSGPAQNGLQSGATMRAGTLSVEGSTSSAHLRFIDGTSLTLSGESELALTGETQKRMTLRRGSLNADVRTQKPGQPMRILTSTAEIEVVGTRFQLSTNSGSTTLSVESGHVRMRRLADGSVVDVRQGEMSLATLETTNSLESSRMLLAPTTFRQTFEQAPSVIWRGTWLPADNQGPGRLQQVPDVSDKKSDGVPRVNYAVCVQDHSGSMVSVGPESVLRVRFRAARERMARGR